MMHHADLDYDLATGLKFHPVEIVLSMVLKLAIIFALGPPAISVLAFEIILNGMAMVNHGNIKIPLSMDRLLRLVGVTPDMHRVHHCVIIRETNSNYGFNLSTWDNWRDNSNKTLTSMAADSMSPGFRHLLNHIGGVIFKVNTSIPVSYFIVEN